MLIKPRIYQKLAIRPAIEGLREKLRALVVMATGLGKTLTSAFIAKKFCAKRILFLVHNNFILKHAVEEYSLVFSDTDYNKVVYNGFSKKGAYEADIVFATWQTMGNNLSKWKSDHFDLIIVDEAHHTEADTYRPVVDYFTGPKLGITATPNRQDDADIREVFGPEVIDISLEEAIARGWLPRIEYHVMIDENLDDEVLKEIAKEIREGKKRFSMAEVNRRLFIKKRDEEIARIINVCDEKAVVFCASVDHAERLATVLDSADTFHSKKGKGQKDTWDKNQAVLDALGTGELRRVCAINAFNEGVNVPSIGLVVFCRTTESYTIFKQQLGRGARPGKEKLIVYDFVSNLERIELVREMVNKISDLHEKFTSSKERKKEGYTRDIFEVSGKEFEFTFSDKIVDLMSILNHCRSEFYSTWQEASEVARALCIKSKLEYHQRYREDNRLPSKPNESYKDFPGYNVFLGTDFYPTWQEASEAVIRLCIKSKKEYEEKYIQDKKLPSTPHKFYKDFPGFISFLGHIKLYPTWQEASIVVKNLGIRSKAEYTARFKEDRRLPSAPNQSYRDFPGYKKFLGKS
ncbi:MAG: DEAD/DEAH box helicase family protein [Candidatus Nomurabacteria bacterium]|nr:DEAD/DEAH box helicase family protein [Candidatus Nomurabacteria bacterium]USN88018.1 MAG: DEAD/DEAH box helicase family protein [Candidatus Nomurabacteria bacterium]